MLVLEHPRAHRHHRLHDVRLGHLRGAHPPEALLNLCDDRIIQHELAPEELRDRGSRAIIRRGPEPARGDHSAGPLDRILNCLRDDIGIVADRGAMHDLYPDPRKRPREIGSVGIDGEPEQQLVTDGENFYLHWS